MLNNIRTFIENYKSSLAHKNKLREIRIKKQRQIELCIAEHQFHDYAGIYLSYEGRICKRCGYRRRSWIYGGDY